jgi:hypothetical protein
MPWPVEVLKKLYAFCDMVQTQQKIRMAKVYPGLTPPTVVCETGSKYARIVFVDSQRMARYFVRTDGAIFACKSWKSPNLNRSFGTLDTTDEFLWGNYEAVAKADSKLFTMKGTRGPYQSAVPK